MLIHAYVRASSALTERLADRLAPPAEGSEAGQASAEYALVLLGAAAIALLVAGWATKTNKIAGLLDGVVDQLLDRVK